MTREQERAQAVYEKLKGYENKPEEWRKSYGSMALRFPALLRSAGLVQALEFVRSRGRDEHKTFIDDFAEAFLYVRGGPKPEESAFKKLSSDVRKAPLPEYIRLTREALALSDWFKRFTQSILKVEPGGD